MVSRQITQDTFDAVVRENITEFEMDPEEALSEAVQQFESQGVDLSNIIKAPRKPGDDENDQTHEILQTLELLRKSVDSSAHGEMGDLLLHFSEQCKQGLANRFQSAQKSAYPVLLSAWNSTLGDRNLMLKALHAMTSLTDGQPDLFEPVGQQLLVKTLEENTNDADVTLIGIQLVRRVCLKHEQNRQDLVKAGILPLLTGALVKHGTDAELVRKACSALKIMTFDDDIRVPFSHAHDHAKKIVLENNGLKVIIDAAKGFMDNSTVLSELCSVLAHLSVRNEFCQEIVDLGGLNFMVALLADCIDHQDLVKEVLNTIRAVAGNDDVKDAIVNTGGTDLIVLAMNRHLSSPQICEQGCAALCMLALRKPDNCKVIMEGGGVLAALQAMKVHPKEVNVQKQACMLIRNLVSRMREFSQPILEMGAETLILEAQAAHRDCADAAKAALRDLGCKVELRELWTGQKGSLAQ
uniref:Armadillo repeat-containing protein 6 isoform X1 n=1 Tax=Geotrypetes seraphini TaxID=260995 RepID=A0A6P8RYF9_GEOSA|nr:armadillo repeat-containing protein 6 isoform X1 [Geotrypetes seraphini]XP_033810183.1 armadillo repeat-containing protein 6 isoform X1 [Geotrypetes seraphini]